MRRENLTMDEVTRPTPLEEELPPDEIEPTEGKFEKPLKNNGAP
jgi:hypothetical protein